MNWLFVDQENSSYNYFLSNASLNQISTSTFMIRLVENANFSFYNCKSLFQYIYPSLNFGPYLIEQGFQSSLNWWVFGLELTGDGNIAYLSIN